MLGRHSALAESEKGLPPSPRIAANLGSEKENKIQNRPFSHLHPSQRFSPEMQELDQAGSEELQAAEYQEDEERNSEEEYELFGEEAVDNPSELEEQEEENEQRKVPEPEPEKKGKHQRGQKGSGSNNKGKPTKDSVIAKKTK